MKLLQKDKQRPFTALGGEGAYFSADLRHVLDLHEDIISTHVTLADPFDTAVFLVCVTKVLAPMLMYLQPYSPD